MTSINAGFNVQLTPEEREELIWVLDRTLGETRVEERHSAGHDYREKVRHEEALLRSLLQKLRDPV